MEKLLINNKEILFQCVEDNSLASTLIKNKIEYKEEYFDLKVCYTDFYTHSANKYTWISPNTFLKKYGLEFAHGYGDSFFTEQFISNSEFTESDIKECVNFCKKNENPDLLQSNKESTPAHTQNVQ